MEINVIIEQKVNSVLRTGWFVDAGTNHVVINATIQLWVKNVMITHYFVTEDIENVADDVTIHHTGRYVSTIGWCAPEGINVVVVLATENLLTRSA